MSTIGMTIIFRQELEKLINKHGIDNLLNTPDYILANYVIDSLMVYGNATEKRDSWHNFKTLDGDGNVKI
jgi:hypothetical protein